MGFTGQLSFWDSAAQHQSDLGNDVDWFGFWVFAEPADGIRPSTQQLIAHLESRFDYLAGLRCRVQDVPGQLDRPYLVRIDRPFADHLTVHSAVSDYQGYLTTVSDVGSRQVNARDKVFHLHVFPEVSGYPGCDRPVTIIVNQVSHTVIAGSGVGTMLQALFSDTPVQIAIPGQGAIRARKLSRVHGSLRSLVGPLKTVPFLARLATHSSRSGAPVAPATDAHPVDDVVDLADLRYGSPPEFRLVTFPSARLRGAGVTVTAAAATAISLAMQRNAQVVRQREPSVLRCNVVVSLPNAAFMGVNNLGYGMISLHSEIADVRERARAIAEDIRSAVERATDPGVLASAVIQGEVPYVLNRTASALSRRLRKLPTGGFPDPLTHTGLTSFKAGGPGLNVAGMPILAGAVWQGGDAGMAYSAVGIGDLLTLCVTSRGVIDDLDGYAELLANTLNEVADALVDDGAASTDLPSTQPA